ncbi:MAG: hypothetical protein ACJA2S_000527 [Cyclobacteriaceae bacterium]|jgi:hypothetical protein
MRTLKLFACVTLLILVVNVDFGKAQSYNLSLAGVYGDNIERLGINARVYYNLPNDKVCFGTEYSHFLTNNFSEGGHDISKKLYEFNFNVHYIIELEEKLGVYPVAGLNLSKERESFVDSHGDTEKENFSGFGTNLGFGIHRSFNRWMLFAEYMHLVSNASQNSYLLGVFVTLGKKHEVNEKE